MGLYNDTKELLLNMFGPDIAKQVDVFEDPEKYPKEFLDECEFFLSKLIGEEATLEKIRPLYKKYVKAENITA